MGLEKMNNFQLIKAKYNVIMNANIEMQRYIFATASAVSAKTDSSERSKSEAKPLLQGSVKYIMLTT